MGGGVERVGVARVHHDLVDARVLAASQDLLPGLAGIDRLEKAAVPSGRPQRPLGRDVDDVRVPRIDDDVADVLGPLEPHVLPGLAAVTASVDAVAIPDVASAHVLTRPHPHDVGGVRIDRDAADRVGALVVEDRLPRGARVGRLPDAATSDCDVTHAVILRVDRDVGDAPGHQRGADAAQLESLEGVFVQLAFGLLLGSGAGSGTTQRKARGEKGAGPCHFETPILFAVRCSNHSGAAARCELPTVPAIAPARRAPSRATGSSSAA